MTYFEKKNVETHKFDNIYYLKFINGLLKAKKGGGSERDIGRSVSVASNVLQNCLCKLLFDMERIY